MLGKTCILGSPGEPRGMLTSASVIRVLQCIPPGRPEWNGSRGTGDPETAFPGDFLRFDGTQMGVPVEINQSMSV